MRSVIGTALALLFFTSAVGAGVSGHQQTSQGAGAVRQELQVWKEFVDLLSAGAFPAEKLSPYQEDLRASMLGFLSTMRSKADWREWRRDPEVVRVADQVHFLLPLTFDGQAATYCFSFALVNGGWFFQHLEAITIRLDRVGPLPAREFPDITEPEKAWIREEVQVSRDVLLFKTLVAEKGRESALEWFKDGAGYALAARALVPFERPSKAFILYLCWEQSRLRGNDLVLQRLDENGAVVRLKPIYFALYERSAHLKQQIGFDDYRALFESRWRDRAVNAGWTLDISYEAGECVFRFAKRER